MHRNARTHMYLLVVMAVAIGALAVAQIGPPTSSARTTTQLITTEKGVVQSTVSGTGNVEAGADLAVNFKTSGTLSKVYVKAGQHVTKGQLLATLDSGSAQLSLDQAEQSLTAAQDQLRTSEAASTSATGSASTTAGLDMSSGSGTTEFVSNVVTVPTNTSTSATTPTTTTPKTTTTPQVTTTPETTSTTTPQTTTTTPQTTTTTPQTTTAPTATVPATTPPAFKACGATGHFGGGSGRPTTTTG
jgi:hypothetical protein